MGLSRKLARSWIILILLVLACGSYVIVISSRGSALLIGNFLMAGEPFCPHPVRIEINHRPLAPEFDPACTFAIQPLPVGNVFIFIQFGAVTGTLDIQEVKKDEVLEVAVAVQADALSISLLRRLPPTRMQSLPVSINAGIHHVHVPAGTFEQSLNLAGDDLILTGEAHPHLESCGAESWTTLAGKVTIRGNQTLFRNIKFLGDLDAGGNRVLFVNSCIGENLLVFANESVLPQKESPTFPAPDQ